MSVFVNSYDFINGWCEHLNLFYTNKEEFMCLLEEWKEPVTETKRYKRWKYTRKI